MKGDFMMPFWFLFVSGFVMPALRFLCLILATLSLAGCLVTPSTSPGSDLQRIDLDVPGPWKPVQGFLAPGDKEPFDASRQIRIYMMALDTRSQASALHRYLSATADGAARLPVPAVGSRMQDLTAQAQAAGLGPRTLAPDPGRAKGAFVNRIMAMTPAAGTTAYFVGHLPDDWRQLSSLNGYVHCVIRGRDGPALYAQTVLGNLSTNRLETVLRAACQALPGA